MSETAWSWIGFGIFLLLASWAFAGMASCVETKGYERAEVLRKRFDMEALFEARKYAMTNLVKAVVTQNLGKIIGGQVTAKVTFDFRPQEEKMARMKDLLDEPSSSAMTNFQRIEAEARWLIDEEDFTDAVEKRKQQLRARKWWHVLFPWRIKVVRR